MLPIARRVNAMAAIVAAAKLEARAELGAFVAAGVVAAGVVVRFTEGILTKPLGSRTTGAGV